MHTKITANDAIADSTIVYFRYGGPPITGLRWSAANNHLNLVIEAMFRFDQWAALIFAEPLAPGADIVLDTDHHGRGISRTIKDAKATTPHLWHSDPFRPPGGDRNDPPLAKSLYNLTKLSITHGAPIEHAAAAGLFWHIDNDTAIPGVVVLHKTGESPRKFHVPEEFAGEQIPYDALDARGLHRLLNDRGIARWNGTPLPTITDPALWIASRYSKLIVGRIKEKFNRAFDNPLSLRAAIGLFASGRLRLARQSTWLTNGIFVTDGAPHGPMFMHFAEFGMLCIDLGIDRSAWKIVTPAFIAALELYRFAYTPYDDPTSRTDPAAPISEYQKRHAQIQIGAGRPHPVSDAMITDKMGDIAIRVDLEEWLHEQLQCLFNDPPDFSRDSYYRYFRQPSDDSGVSMP